MTNDYEQIPPRVQAILGKTPFVFRLTLQYRLCETGRERIAHQLFDAAFPELVRSGELLECIPGLFCGSSTSLTRERKNELEAIAQPWVNRTPEEDDKALDLITHRIVEPIGTNGFTIGDTANLPWMRLNSASPQSRSRQVDLTSTRLAATLCVSLQEQALCPTSPDFWKFMEDCSHRGRVPLLLARAVSLATFPVLKTIGAKALQYYFLPTIREGAELQKLESIAERFGLPPVRRATDWGDHAVFATLTNQLQYLATSPLPEVERQQALQIALSRGFSKRSVTPIMLKNWADDVQKEIGVRLPTIWKQEMTAWSRILGRH